MNRKTYAYVENKLDEAKFFLEKMKETRQDLRLLRFNFSAFLSAARSITWTLQRNMKEIDGFEQWYEGQQKELKANPVVEIMNNARVDTVHKGKIRVSFPGIYLDEQGRLQLTHYITDTISDDSIRDFGDVFHASETYVNSLQKLVNDFEKRFPEFIDLDKLYTIKGLKARKMTIEDLEEQLGFERGWTRGIPDRERLRLLKQSTPPLLYKEMFRDIADIENRNTRSNEQ